MPDTCGATNSNSICILPVDHEGRHFDARNGHSWQQTEPVDEPTQSNDDGEHQANCCSIHGCKYAATQQQENECPVANGTLRQDHPCELCEWSDEALRQATDAQIAAELTRRGYHEAAGLVQ